MKTKFRKIAALALSLVLICALAAAVYAYEVSEAGVKVWCYDVQFHTLVEGDGTYVRAEMIEDVSGNGNYNSTVTLNYTYCPADQNRPSAYVSGKVVHTFTRYTGLKYADYTLNGNSYLMVDATGTTVVTKTVNGTTYTTEAAPVTIYIN